MSVPPAIFAAARAGRPCHSAAPPVPGAKKRRSPDSHAVGTLCLTDLVASAPVAPAQKKSITSRADRLSRRKNSEP